MREGKRVNGEMGNKWMTQGEKIGCGRDRGEKRLTDGRKK